jgi:hypothetical protein
MGQDMGASAGADPATQATPGAVPSPPSGECPLRSRVRIILDCDWEDLQRALDTVIGARAMFDRVPKRPGWGWRLGHRADKPSFFVRQTKHGFSATADKAIAMETGTAIDAGGGVVAKP